MAVNGHAFRMAWGPSTDQGSKATAAVSNAVSAPLNRYYFSASVGR